MNHNITGPKNLTRRELQCLTLAAAGNTLDMIARRLFLASDTVKMYMGTAKRKLGANDRTHAVALALRDGLIDFPSSSWEQGKAA